MQIFSASSRNSCHHTVESKKETWSRGGSVKRRATSLAVSFCSWRTDILCHQRTVSWRCSYETHLGRGQFLSICLSSSVTRILTIITIILNSLIDHILAVHGVDSFAQRDVDGVWVPEARVALVHECIAYVWELRLQNVSHLQDPRTCVIPVRVISWHLLASLVALVGGSHTC